MGEGYGCGQAVVLGSIPASGTLVFAGDARGVRRVKLLRHHSF